MTLKIGINPGRQAAVSSKVPARQAVFKYKCGRRPYKLLDPPQQPLMSEALFVGPVDNVRRDTRDGAYHCPQCDTPFTRRSNLRRHFQIREYLKDSVNPVADPVFDTSMPLDMRSPLFKCENCGEEYTTK
jgi:predicted RNA-binding Zn-ribbon protein involved in translation (DUF1610 family)